MYVCVCVCVYTYGCVEMLMCAREYVYKYIWVCIDTYVCVHVCMRALYMGVDRWLCM